MSEQLATWVKGHWPILGAVVAISVAWGEMRLAVQTGTGVQQDTVKILRMLTEELNTVKANQTNHVGSAGHRPLVKEVSDVDNRVVRIEAKFDNINSALNRIYRELEANNRNSPDRRY